MSAFTFGLIMGGSVGIPLACAIASRRKARKEEQDGSKDLTKDEYDVLKEKAGRSGLSLSAFVRKAVAGKEIAESPPADVPMLIREVRRVGFNITQILRAINGKGFLDEPELRRALEMNRSLELLISNSYGASWR